MYKLCKSEQSAMRQRELEQQLLSMMNTVRYEEITVSDFCMQAGIPRKAFYRYFSSKDGALHALIDHTLLELEIFPSVDRIHTGDTLQKELTGFFRFWHTRKPLLDALERSNLSGLLVTRAMEYALSDIGAVRKTFPHRVGADQQYITTFGVCGFMSMVLRWHQDGYQLPPAQMAQIAAEFLSKPLIRSINP